MTAIGMDLIPAGQSLTECWIVGCQFLVYQKVRFWLRGTGP